MSSSAIPAIAHGERKFQAIFVPPHLRAYGWIYVFFCAMTAFALYVMFTMPPVEM